MRRRGVVITLVFLLSLAAQVSAEPPRQADVDACNKEAAAAGPLPAASSDDRKPGATANAPTTGMMEDRDSAAATDDERTT